MIEPGLSEVVTYTAAGTQPRWLGTLGHVENLKYSWVNPGGADQMSCTLQVPGAQRTDALNPGRQCKVWRGGTIIWDGKLMEPAWDPVASGWQLTAVGIGNAGTDFPAYYTSAWGSGGNQNDAVNAAITRGLRWVNPGITSGVWFGQAVDPASITVTDLLNLFCTRGGLTWYVSTGRYANTLSVYAFPAAVLANVNRVIVATSPPPRTLGGDINSLFLRYQNSADTAVTATFLTTQVTTPASITMHGEVGAFDDLSSAGTQTAGQAQAVGTSILNRYQRASYAGGFTIRYGQLLTPGGAPVDPGIDHCGTICKVILAGWGYGGEVVPDPAVFMTGHYEWDEHAQTALVTPFQSLRLSVSGLAGEVNTVLGWQAQQEAALDVRQAARAARAAAAQAALRRRLHLPRGFNPGGVMRVPPRRFPGTRR